MYHINFNNPVHVHFIGIGGISMSGLAEILLDRKFTVSGSDAKESGLTAHLTGRKKNLADHGGCSCLSVGSAYCNGSIVV